MTNTETVQSNVEGTTVNEAALIELAELQLASIGGGCGDVLWG